jgi:ribose transport system permease protein
MHAVRRYWPFDLRSLSVVYVIAVTIVVFGAWIPGRFLQTQTFAGVLNNGAVSGIVALALLLPLAAGLFDFSIAYSLGVSSVLSAWLLGNTGLATGWCVVLCALAGATIGAVNAVVVVVFKINSFIGTLATGSLLQAAILIVTGNQILTKGVMRPEFVRLAQGRAGQFTLPVIYFVVLAVGVWFFMAHTASGRRLYAIGLSLEAARLAGIRTEALRFGALMASSTLAALAGVLVTSRIGAGSPDVGPPFLIPAYAAAFLGLAQSRLGLFNSWGTTAAVVLLSTVTLGLGLAGAPIWSSYVFTGLVLIAAIGLSGVVPHRRKRSAAAKPDADVEAGDGSELRSPEVVVP